MGHRSMAALTLLQKHIHQRDIATLTDQLATLLMADYLSSPQVIALIHYLLQAGESADSEAFVREVAQRVPQHGDTLMTIAQLPGQKATRRIDCSPPDWARSPGGNLMMLIQRGR